MIGISDINILMVEDSANDALLIQKELRKCGLIFEASRVDNTDDLIYALSHAEWDIVLCDYALPNLDVPRVLGEVTKQSNRLPVIVVSGTVGEEVVADLMLAGVADVVLKDKLSPRLGPVVIREVSRARALAVGQERELRREAVFSAFSESSDWRQAAELSLRQIALSYGADLAVMLEAPAQGDLLCPIAAWALPATAELASALVEWPLSLHSTVAGRSVLENKPIILPDICLELAGTTELTFLRKLAEFGVVSMLAIPVEALDRRFGLTIMFRQRVDKLEEMLEELLLTAKSLQPALIRKLIEYERNLLRSALDATRSGVLITDAMVDAPGPRIEYANFAAAAITGRTPESMNGTSPRMFQGPNTDRATLTRIRAELEAAEPISVELLNYRASGEVFDLELDINPVLDGTRVTNFIAIQTDITSRKQAQAAQQIAEEELRALVDLGPGVLYRVAIDEGCIKLMSVRGNPRRLAQTPDVDETSERAVRRLLEQPATQVMLTSFAAGAERAINTIDVRVETSNSTQRWLRNSVRIVNRDGGAVDLAGYICDVTPEREEQLRAKAMETLVTLGKLATGMAHELNQPLASICFIAENAQALLRREMIDRGAVESKLKKIVTESLRASKLINHMCLFARNEVAALQPVSFNDVVGDALELLAPRLRDFAVNLNMPPDLPVVVGSPIPLEQVVINLLCNAMDSYETVSGSQVSTPRVLAITGGFDDEYVNITVADRAGGIPEAILSRIFEPFFTTKLPGKGTGLGLALCLSTITDMGGQLNVRNENGGAVFHLRLLRSLPERQESRLHQ